MTPMPKPAQSRMPGLDALRGIAALLVVIYHYTIVYKAIQEHKDALWFTFPYPAVGVQIFFVISGFVIFMTLERSRSGRDFAVSRFARLYPPFIACLLVTVLVAWGSGFNPRNIGLLDAMFNLPMVVGVLDGVYVDGSYWTLTCEICFYVFIAVFYYQIQQRWYAGRSSFDGVLKNPLVYAMAAWMVVDVAGRTHTDSLTTRWALALNFQYGHMFLAGIAVYGITIGRKLVPAVLLALAVVLGGMPDLSHLGVTASIKILLFAALVWMASRVRLDGWMAALASFLGGISYSLYLLHQSVGYNIIYHLEERGVNSNHAVLVATAVMIFLAYLVRRYVEISAQDWILQTYKRWKTQRQARDSMGLNKLSPPIDIQ